MSMGMYFVACRAHFAILFMEMNAVVSRTNGDGMNELKRLLHNAFKYHNSMRKYVR